MRSERQIALDSDATVKAATVTATELGAVTDKVGAVADDVDKTITQAKPAIASALANLDSATAGLNAAVAELNAPCADGRPCGTLADVNRTLASIRLASGQVTTFSLKEQTQVDQVNQQETAIAAGTESDLAKLGTAIDGIKDATDEIGALATNKDLTGSLAKTNTALGAVAGMATDTEQYWHGILHPKLPKRIWNALTGAGISVAKFFF